MSLISDSGIRVEDDGAKWVMWGEVDTAVQVRSEAEIARCNAHSAIPITIDLTRVTFMDSGGLRLLYQAAIRSPEPPILLNPARGVRDLLEVSDAVGLFRFQS